MVKLFHKRTKLFPGILVFFMLILFTEMYALAKDFQEQIVAGSPGDFMEVRHVVLKGSNFEIGKQIAALAVHAGIQLQPGGDPLMNKLKRQYLALNFPIYYERMKGVAAAFGFSITDDRCDFSAVSQTGLHPPGCSVVFYPGKYTENGHGMLSRNYDFTTGTVQGTQPRSGEKPIMARPYIFEIYPDRGYASLAVCAFDMLGGVLDGVNSQGLAVAILAEQESPRQCGREPGNEVGLHELQSMRYLLDNCKNAAQAKEALLSLKHFYILMPCHYIIADSSGESFIFEFSPSRNRSLITNGKGPQCVTNHLVALHANDAELPTGNSFDRYKKLAAAIKDKEKFTLAEIRDINSQVAVPPVVPANPAYAPGRTLWYALYDTQECSLSIRFYLGETPDPANPEQVIFRYSEPLNFRLNK